MSWSLPLDLAQLSITLEKFAVSYDEWVLQEFLLTFASQRSITFFQLLKEPKRGRIINALMGTKS